MGVAVGEGVQVGLGVRVMVGVRVRVYKKGGAAIAPLPIPTDVMKMARVHNIAQPMQPSDASRIAIVFRSDVPELVVSFIFSSPF